MRGHVVIHLKGTGTEARDFIQTVEQKVMQLDSIQKELPIPIIVLPWYSFINIWWNKIKMLLF